MDNEQIEEKILISNDTILMLEKVILYYEKLTEEEKIQILNLTLLKLENKLFLIDENLSTEEKISILDRIILMLEKNLFEKKILREKMLKIKILILNEKILILDKKVHVLENGSVEIMNNIFGYGDAGRVKEWNDIHDQTLNDMNNQILPGQIISNLFNNITLQLEKII